MTRDQAIEAIVTSMEDWDMDSIMDYAMDCMDRFLTNMSNEELMSEYETAFDKEITIEETDNDN